MQNNLVKIFCFSLLIFQASSVWSNVQKADSLKQLIALSPDSQLVFLLSDICYEYRFDAPDSALHYGNLAVTLAKKLNYPKALAQALNDRGIANADLSNYSLALADYQASLAIRTNLNDSLGIAAIHNKIGIIYQKQGAYSDAIEHQLMALRIYEALKIDAYIAFCQNNVAILHYNLGNAEKSIEMHFQALETRLRLKDDFAIASSYANIANVFLSLTDTTSAIEYYEKAVSVFRNLAHQEGLSTSLHNWAACYAKSNPQQALQLLTEALAIREAMGDEKMQASTHASMGNVLLNLGQFKKSRHHLKEGLKLASTANVLAEQLSIYQTMARLYKSLNNSDSTFYYFEKYTSVKDSAYNVDLREDFAELQTRYETEKQAAEIALLSEQNKVSDLQLQRRLTQLWLLIAVFIGISLIATLAYFRYKEKQKEKFNLKLIQEREERLKAVFTATEAERGRIAKDLHDGVGQQLSGLKMGWQKLFSQLNTQNPALEKKVETLTEVLDDACTEVRSISHQMMPKSLLAFGLVPSFEDMLQKSLGAAELKYEFDHFGLTDFRLNADQELIIFRVAQELINNILKHANANYVSIQLFKNNANLILMVQDDGKGFNFEKAKGGLGLLNITSRLNMIKGTVEVETSEGTGTITNIRIPLA